MTTMPHGSLIRIALLDSHRLACEHDIDSWFGKLFQYLQNIGCAEFVEDVEGNANLFDLAEILRVMRRMYHDQFRGLPRPREADSHCLKLATYHYWFASPLPGDDGEWDIQGYLRRCIKHDVLTKLSRFRQRSHSLRIECEKWQPKSVQATVGARYCLRCHQNVVDDECHAVFHCSQFHSHRSQFPDLFELYLGEEDMRDLFTSKSNAHRLARYLQSICVC
jgi:hypothetical protein